MKENGKMEKEVELEYFTMQMELNIWEVGKTI